MVEHANFPTDQLQALCDVLGDTGTGLTGGEIGRLLGQCGIHDPIPTLTKRHRLFEALNARQANDGCSNAVLAFVKTAMAPVSYRGKSELFEARRHAVNEVLAFAGFQLGEDGSLRKAQKASTLLEAQERAGRLRSELQRRGVHADVLHFCRPELLQQNYFHAVLEATKSVAEKIRSKSGLQGDGAPLIDAAFGTGKAAFPLMVFNSLRTDSERSEHTGLMNLMKGMFGTFRNPTGHAPKISWTIDERDALDLLTLVSLIHRRLDHAIVTPQLSAVP